MEILVGIGAKISEYMVEPISHQLGYLFNYKSNLENLRTQFQNLKEAKEKLEHSIDEAKRNGEEIEADVLNWMSRVDGISEQVQNFLRDHDEGQAYRRCFRGQFPDLLSRNQLSRKAKKMGLEVASVTKVAEGFHKVSYLPILQSIFEVKGYVAFLSRMSTFSRIMEALRNPDFDMIGLYGMGGVGKTMLCKEVAQKAKELMLFSKVIMVTVSQSPKLESIQQEVAEKLGLKLKEKSIPARADRLIHRLRQENKMLLILDDIWEKLELQDIGISFGDDKKECKILLTSRSLDVLYNEMGVEQNFSVGVLFESEATKLFNIVVGDTVKDSSVQSLATGIIKECGGLPIAITTVANALRNKSRPVWSNALQELRTSAPSNIKGMHEKVYSSIKLSYDFLRSEEAKSLLLLCSLFHEDANIDYEHLLRHGMGWGLFQGITKLEEARNKVVTLVEDLKTRCLLLDGDYNGSVKMHDVVRDVIKSIASKDRSMYNISNNSELDGCFNYGTLRDSIAISLSDIGRDCQLPERLDFPKVQLFCMNWSRPFRNIFMHYRYPYFRDGQNLEVPSHLFEGMKELRVLELTSMSLEPLPSSFSLFQNIQTLCLWYCNMGEVAIIGELKNLKILDLSGSDIKELPKQIGQLTRLQLLDLKYCSQLKVIRPNIISNLTSLQELNMDRSFTEWDVEGDGGERRNASLKELKNLHQLATLHLDIPDANTLPKDFFSEKLERFNIIIGDVRVRYYDFGISRKLSLKINKSNILTEHGVEVLLRKSEVLYLDGLECSNNVVQELDSEGFQQLKELHFQNNVRIQYIVNSMEENHTCSAFANLELLHIGNLGNLENICNGKLAQNCFGKLRDIEVNKCDKLKNLFPFSVARDLLQLKRIKVTSCKLMEEIITYGREGDSQNMSEETVQKIRFPELRTLKLCYLPELVHFYSMAEPNCRTHMEGKQLIVDSAVSLFNEKVTCPKLTNLTLERSDYLKEIWHGQSEGLLGDEEPTCIFSGLRGLRLAELPNLMHIWDEKYQIDIAFSNLMSLCVVQCDMLKNLAPSWISFQNLLTLQVSNCYGMVNLLTSSTAKTLAQLRILAISGCKSMTEIIASKGSETGGEIVFNQLVALECRWLPSLTSFYSGNLVMRFPKLKYVGLSNCPEMSSFSHGVVSTPLLGKLTLIDEEWDDEVYNLDDGVEWTDGDYTEVYFAELDFDEAMIFDDERDSDIKRLQELIEGDINITIRELWERDQFDVALQQLFAE